MPELTLTSRQEAFLSKTVIVLRAYGNLIHFDLYIVRRSFPLIYKTVRKHPVGMRVRLSRTVEEICYAVDLACIWYWREALCLQRSAATTCLLRDYGYPAQLVIGAQQMPFKAHAWVEVDGRVVNDKPYMQEMYVVLDRC